MAETETRIRCQPCGDGKGFVVAKVQVFLNGGRKRSIGILASFGFGCLVLTCLLFPKIMFAAQPESVLETDFPPAQSSPANEVSSEQETLPDAIEQQPTVASPAQADTPAIVEKPEAKDHWQVVRMRVTAYCPCSQCCGAFSDGITANNHRIQPGDTFVAADKSYRFGTEMVIPGYNAGQPVKVMDRGGAIKGNHLDLFFHTHQEALEWGIKHLDVLVKIE